MYQMMNFTDFLLIFYISGGFVAYKMHLLQSFIASLILSSEATWKDLETFELNFWGPIICLQVRGNNLPNSS